MPARNGDAGNAGHWRGVVTTPASSAAAGSLSPTPIAFGEKLRPVGKGFCRPGRKKNGYTTNPRDCPPMKIRPPQAMPGNQTRVAPFRPGGPPPVYRPGGASRIQAKAGMPAPPVYRPPKPSVSSPAVYRPATAPVTQRKQSLQPVYAPGAKPPAFLQPPLRPAVAV